VAASTPPLLQVGSVGREQRRTRSPRLSLGETLSVQESPHRAASQFETASDLPQTHALVMQSTYRLVSRLPLGPSVVLLALQPRQTSAGQADRIGNLGLYCWRDWSFSQCGDQFFRSSPDRNVLSREQTLQCFSQIDVGWAASEVPRRRAFSNGLPPNRAGPLSEHPALQYLKP
jgi:hypothetical protein